MIYILKNLHYEECKILVTPDKRKQIALLKIETHSANKKDINFTSTFKSKRKN